MKKTMCLVAVMLMATFAGAQVEQIDASTVNFFTPDPLPAAGTAFDLCFDVTVDSPDTEYMDRFEVDLPDAWTVNSVTLPALTGCGSADPGVSGTDAGNVVLCEPLIAKEIPLSDKDGVRSAVHSIEKRVMPLAGPVSNVTIEGAQYPLLGETLTAGGMATIGNHVTMSPLLISVGDGPLLVSVDREEGPEYIEGLLESD